MNHLFTSESVTDGHPDKICDLIADTILDEALSQDKDAKMAVEATIKDDFILIYGEANTTAVLDYAAIAKRVIRSIGYLETYEVLVKVNHQSLEINAAVARAKTAAGDQGIMFGYACDETESLMPLPISLAQALAKRLSEAKAEIAWLRPDGKTQVTVAYDEADHPEFVKTILISAQHASGIDHATIAETLRRLVIDPVIPAQYMRAQTEVIINPSGSFVVGGSFGDSGTTGRKIVVDTYGGMGRIGGGCFSSKDPSKVDRSAAYFARYVAKSVVASGLASRVEVQLSYAIGLENPLSVFVDTFNTGILPDSQIQAIVLNNFDFSVANIITELDLLKPIYHLTTNYGHFGHDGFTWEVVKPLQY